MRILKIKRICLSPFYVCNHECNWCWKRESATYISSLYNYDTYQEEQQIVYILTDSCYVYVRPRFEWGEFDYTTSEVHLEYQTLCENKNCNLIKDLLPEAC